MTGRILAFVVSKFRMMSSRAAPCKNCGTWFACEECSAAYARVDYELDNPRQQDSIARRTDRRFPARFDTEMLAEEN